MISARASFSDNDTNSSIVLGFARSNSPDRAMVSCTCEFETIAMVLLPEVNDLAPAQPPTPNHGRRGFRLLSHRAVFVIGQRSPSVPAATARTRYR